MRQIGVNLGLWKGVDPQTAAQKTKALGFDCVFTGVPNVNMIPVIRTALEENGLVWETMHAPFGHINDMWCQGEGGDIMLRELMGGIDCCVLGGVKMMVVHLSSGDKAPSVTDIGRGRFEELVAYAATRGITVAFENQRKLANLAWAMEAFPEGSNVGFCWDCGHESCFTPGRQYMPVFGKRLVCTHIHDNYGIYNGDDHMIPFDATIDFDRVSRQLRESRYAGSLMLELNPAKHERYAGMSWDAYFERAAAAAKKLRDMVDGPAEH